MVTFAILWLAIAVPAYLLVAGARKLNGPGYEFD